MKNHKYNHPFRISLVALALGASVLVVDRIIHRPADSGVVSTAKSHLTPRNPSKQTPHVSSQKKYLPATATATTVAPQDIPPSHATPRLFQKFNDWALQYEKASLGERQQLLASGENMVKQRHEQMANLIEKSPQVALDEADALSPIARQALPASLRAQLEQPVNARGDIAVVAYLGESVAPYKRFTTLDDQEYTVFPAGENEPLIKELNRSLLGIKLEVNRITTTAEGKQFPRLDRVMALRKDRVRILSSEEVLVARKSLRKGSEPACEVSGKSVVVNESPAAIETGGNTKWVCQPDHATAWLKTPEGIRAASAPKGMLAVGGPGEGAGSFPAVPVGWSTGNKTFLCVRFRCQDQPTTLYNGLEGSIPGMLSQLNQWSYGKINFTSYTISPLLVLPHTFSEYQSGLYNAQDDAWALARQNYNLNNYSFKAICVSGLWDFAGSAGILGSEIQINDPSNYVFQHELGHNLGLPHANLWVPTTSDPIGPGSASEYGGSYDTMGSNWSPFNAMARFYIRWLTMSETHDLASRTGGTYTIYDPDVTSLTAGRKHVIRIPRSDGSFYFVEFRPRPTALTNNATVDGTTQNGIRILRSKNSELLDVTPLSPGDQYDAALVVGKEFYDAGENITIKAIAKGGSGVDQYFQVQVSFVSAIASSGHTYMLRAREGNLLAGVINYSGDNGGQIAQQNFEGYPNQKWMLMKVDASNYKIVNMNSGKVMEVGGYSTVNGGTVQQWEYIGIPSQKWQIVATSDSYFKLINSGSGLALTVPYPTTQAGIQLQQYTYQGSSNQQWAFDEVSPLVSGATYQIMARNSGKVMDVAGFSSADGGNVLQWTWYGTGNQKWTVSSQGGAVQALTSMNSGKVLEVAGYSMGDGGNVQQWAWVGNPWQKWTLEAVDSDAGGFWYKLVNVGSGKVADVSNADTSDGSNIQHYSYWGGLNQQWRFTPAP